MKQWSSRWKQLKAGLTEAIIIPWEPISRPPGDTTGGIITDLPEHCRTDERNEFFHGTSGYGLPSIGLNGLNSSDHGRGFNRGGRVRLFTSKSVRTCLGFAPAVAMPFPCAEPLVFEEDDVYMVSKSLQFVLCIPGEVELSSLCQTAQLEQQER